MDDQLFTHSFLPLRASLRHVYTSYAFGATSCAGSSRSSSTWPCRAGARYGCGSMSFRYHNARATCRSRRSARSRATRSFVRGVCHIPSARIGLVGLCSVRPRDACVSLLGSSRSCATPKHGARSTASPRLIARCRRARCRPTAVEAGAGASFAFGFSSLHNPRTLVPTAAA